MSLTWIRDAPLPMMAGIGVFIILYIVMSYFGAGIEGIHRIMEASFYDSPDIY